MYPMRDPLDPGHSHPLIQHGHPSGRRTCTVAVTVRREQVAVSLNWSAHHPMVIRTDFAHDEAWTQIKAAIARPQTEGEFTPNVTFIDDAQFAGLTAHQLANLVPDEANSTVAFLVDQQTLTHPDHPILVVNLFDYDEDTPRRTPRPRVRTHLPGHALPDVERREQPVPGKHGLARLRHQRPRRRCLPRVLTRARP
jgi:uncharacterized protein DUF6924